MIASPEVITSLAVGEIFVFGSNSEGKHIAGAARMALDNFGAIWGQGEGLQGNSYAIPTMGSFQQMAEAVIAFKQFAGEYPEQTFLVTRVGCGIAGFTVDRVAPLFVDVSDNVRLPQSFIDNLQKRA